MVGLKMSPLTSALRPIYTVQLCHMRYAYDKCTTRIVSCKSNLQLACDCRVRHVECHGLLKHVLKPYDNHSDRQFYIVEIVYDFSMTRAARAIKITCDNRKQKSYSVNQPLGRVHNLCRGGAMMISRGGHEFFLLGFRGAIKIFSQ